MNADDTKKHAALMKRWQKKAFHKNKEFIGDGIIDIQRWEKADRKIMFLLKEAYGGYGDLCSLIREEWKGPKYKIWWTTSYWLYALRKASAKFIAPFPKEQKQFEECVEYLLSSAVVNIKKSDGKTSSTKDDLDKYVREDVDMLKEQITLINPGIILCGYTFDHFCKIWPGKVTPLGNTELVFRAGPHVVINWWHPANQYPNDLCYYALCAVVQEANIL
jgi:hypothetical protein